MKAPKNRLPTTTVHETKLVAWYEIGWDLSEMKDDRDEWFVIEWRHDRPAVEPFREDIEERQLATAVAALEGRAVA